jgi:large subunit ribosomal protein L16
MLFIPTKSKYKKQHKGKSFNRVNSNINFFSLNFGCVGLKVVSPGRLNSTELKTLKQTLNKTLKRRACIIMNVFPQTPITKKPLEIRMGKGKGNVNSWVFKAKPGVVLVEIQTKFILSAVKALKLAKIRISLNTVIIYR